MSGIFVFLASTLALMGIYVILATILNLEAGWGGPCGTWAWPDCWLPEPIAT